MSFSVGSLANYTNEQSTDLLVKALFGSKTSSTLQSANQVQVGVKSASALNILASTVFFQADGCGYNPSGTTAFTQRNITVGAVKVEETLCPKTLEAKWMQTQIMPGSPTMIPFDECEATYGADTEVCGGCKEQFKIVNRRADADCHATLGYAPGQEMILNFGEGCFNGGGHRVATHELGHVIGLIHEHVHPEREVIVEG